MKKDSSDVNVLVGLAWENHRFYAAATERLEKRD